MPKENIDYSNTIIYKIICNDASINDVYVGHTTNFTKRKYQHKVSCANLHNNIKIYNIIRKHGGWDNWTMVEIAKYNCKDKTEARIKEQQYYEELKSTLNSCPPYIDKCHFFCTTCNLQCNTLKLYKAHVNCNRHTIKLEQQYNIQSEIHDEQNIIDVKRKNTIKFQCSLCQFECSKNSNYKSHILTTKHKNNTLLNNTEQTSNKKGTFSCKKCNKIYMARNSLWYHEKQCNSITDLSTNVTDLSTNITDLSTDKELIILLTKENSELKQMLLDVCQKIYQTISKKDINTIN